MVFFLIFSSKSHFPYTFVHKTDFTKCCEFAIIMTSYKQGAGNVGTYFGING